MPRYQREEGTREVRRSNREARNVENDDREMDREVPIPRSAQRGEERDRGNQGDEIESEVMERTQRLARQRRFQPASEADIERLVQQRLDDVRAGRDGSNGPDLDEQPENIDGTIDMRTLQGRLVFGTAQVRNEVQGAPGHRSFGVGDPRAKGLPRNKDGTVDRRTRAGRLYQAQVFLDNRGLTEGEERR